MKLELKPADEEAGDDMDSEDSDFGGDRYGHERFDEAPEPEIYQLEDVDAKARVI